MEIPGTMEDCLQPGIKQVAAGYVVYGSSTMLVYTAGAGVHGFTLDPAFGEFILSHPNIQTPKKSKIYSINEGNYLYWHPGLKKYIKYLQDEDKATEPSVFFQIYWFNGCRYSSKSFIRWNIYVPCRFKKSSMVSCVCNTSVILWHLLLNRLAVELQMERKGY